MQNSTFRLLVVLLAVAIFCLNPLKDVMGTANASETNLDNAIIKEAIDGQDLSEATTIINTATINQNPVILAENMTASLNPVNRQVEDVTGWNLNNSDIPATERTSQNPSTTTFDGTATMDQNPDNQFACDFSGWFTPNTDKISADQEQNLNSDASTENPDAVWTAISSENPYDVMGTLTQFQNHMIAHGLNLSINDSIDANSRSRNNVEQIASVILC